MKTYSAKTLFTSSAIGRVDDEHYVAVPEKFDRVYFQGQYMTIKGKKPVAYRKFDDKYGRDKQYVLRYYVWRPDDVQQEVTLFNTFMSIPDKYRDEIKAKLGIK